MAKWISGDELVRAMGGRDHPPHHQPARPRLSDEEVRLRRAEAAERDWSKIVEPEDRERRKPQRRNRRMPHFE